VVFAYDNRARFRAAPSGDGTITLRSQLALPVHLRARNSYGVDATHTGVLTDATTREIVLRLLDEHAAPPGRGTSARCRGRMDRYARSPVRSHHESSCVRLSPGPACLDGGPGRDDPEWLTAGRRRDRAVFAHLRRG